VARRWKLWVALALVLGLVPALILALFNKSPVTRATAAEPRHDRVLIATNQPSPAPSPLTTFTPTPEATPTPAPIIWRLWHDVGYVPILMYHYVRVSDATADPLGFRLSVRPDRFAEQMEWLTANGYQPMTVSALAACLRGETRCPPHPMAITFDDGYDNNVTEALPILRSHGFPATFYIITGKVGTQGYATWAQIRELRDGGMEIGAHTVSHAALTALPLDQARAEIVDSKTEIESRLGITVASFSYPSGDYNETVAALVRAAGFTSAVTTAQDDQPVRLDELPRRRVIGGEAIAGYKWYFVPASLQK
jgi:peptidoglycan/xylan/chitin deacetylase (PgdA/CDA1 family)